MIGIVTYEGDRTATLHEDGTWEMSHDDPLGRLGKVLLDATCRLGELGPQAGDPGEETLIEAARRLDGTYRLAPKRSRPIGTVY